MTGFEPRISDNSTNCATTALPVTLTHEYY